MSTLFLEPVSDSAKLPVKSTTFAACFDIHADTDGRELTMLTPSGTVIKSTYVKGTLYVSKGYTLLVPTGYKMQCEEGYCIKFYPRSGLGIKHGIILANGTGIIDHDYTDECLVAITNTFKVPFKVNQDDRIAQLMVEKLDDTVLEVVTSLPAVDSNRTGGLGSTGK